MHVQGLFKDAPDLLAEFKDFLPEITGQAAPSGVVGILPQPAGGPGVAGPSTWGADSATADRDKASKKPIAPLKRRRKPVEKDTTPAPQPPKAAANNKVCAPSLCFVKFVLLILSTVQTSKTPSQGRLPWIFSLPSTCVPAERPCSCTQPL